MAKAFIIVSGALLAVGTMPIIPAMAQAPCRSAIRSCQLNWPDRYPQYSSYEECVEKESEFRCPPTGGGGSEAKSGSAAIVRSKG